MTASIRADDPADWTGPYTGGTIGLTSAAFAGPVTFPSLITGSGMTLAGATIPFETGRRTSAMGGVQVGDDWLVRGAVAGSKGRGAAPWHRGRRCSVRQRCFHLLRAIHSPRGPHGPPPSVGGWA